MTTKTTTRTDIYTRVTNQIVEQLERGVRPWLKPWNAEHAAGRITRPLRHSGEPYKGINILMLWAAAELQGFNCPLWLTFQQAKQLGGLVRKGEHGSPVVYSIKRTQAISRRRLRECNSSQCQPDENAVVVESSIPLSMHVL